MSNLLDISAVYTINKGFYRFLKNLEPLKNPLRTAYSITKATDLYGTDQPGSKNHIDSFLSMFTVLKIP